MALEEETADDLQLEDSAPLWEDSISQVQLSPGNMTPAVDEGHSEGSEPMPGSPGSDPIGTPSVWS